jgi:phospholipid N-methyltransferase
MLASRAAFLCKFIRRPRQIGSIVPSSIFLTRKMLARLPWQEIETVVELGAGTGVFTRFIDRQMKPGCKLLVIEQDLGMRTTLQSQHPHFHYGENAAKLCGIIQSHSLPAADCIVSGLPFAVFPRALRKEIMDEVHKALRPGGMFVAFQYSLQMKPMFKEYFTDVKIQFVPLNIPPAFVYFCRK